MSRLKRILIELRRRHVFKVVGVYAVGAWAVIEVSTTTFPLLGIPEIGPRLVVWLAILGFPAATVLAWFFDLTPEGVKRTTTLEEASSPSMIGPSPATPPAAATDASHAHSRVASRAAGFFGLGMLVALVTVAAYFRFGPTRASSIIDSIAVMPFVDLSASHDQEYFADGMTEELLDHLAHVEGLRVAARTSSFAFKNTTDDATEIGRKLRVASILEGSIRRDGSKLRVTAQLINARSGYHLWSQSYDVESSSVFDVQDEISSAILKELRKQFAGDTTPESGRTENLVAHDLYLRALARWHYRSEASVREAVSLFEQAVAEDPEYAAAWAGLAQAYAVLPSLGRFSIDEAVAKGSAAAARALSLDAQLADAHAALGQIAQGFEWDLKEAERDYRHAIAFNPGYATAHQWYAETLMMLGNTAQANAEIDKALELDPLSPAAMSVHAYLLSVEGKGTAALEAYRNVTRLYPEFVLGQLNRILLAAYLHQPQELSGAAILAGGDSALATAMRTIVRAAGDPVQRSAAQAAARTLNAANPPAIAALWFAAAGDSDAALQRLEQAVAGRADPNVPFILLHPLFQPLRANPRFAKLLDEVGVVLPAG